MKAFSLFYMGWILRLAMIMTAYDIFEEPIIYYMASVLKHTKVFGYAKVTQSY